MIMAFRLGPAASGPGLFDIEYSEKIQKMGSHD